MLGNGEYDIGGRAHLVEFALDLIADYLGQDHADRLAQHDRFGFNAAHAPTHNAQTVDHGGVRVGAHQAVRVEDILVVEYDSGQTLQVDLVHDAAARWHDDHVLERA